jgi:hypothetical protein
MFLAYVTLGLVERTWRPSRSLGISKAVAFVLLFAVLLCDAQPAAAQFNQLGPKLVGTGNVGNALQGFSVALSADSNTAIVGGLSDSSGAGATWVFTRVGGIWTQQGSKLIGTGASARTGQGISVALSADGNTALVGGYGDNSGAGAAWVFTRSGGTWTQQGPKLVGTGNAGKGLQGRSVALSADGNTALVGGFGDNSLTGAAWVFTRSDGTWAQQGLKLVGTGGSAPTQQGRSVALSADGNTAIVGGLRDAWVFTRGGESWTQQGSKLVGVGSVVEEVKHGISVALSASGRIAVVGEWTDNSEGGAWVFAEPTPYDFNGTGHGDLAHH